ncbi:hypothetical protein D9758_011690 [Tetrapyrgos nigripes]|uniref:Uncharacterized protein n=1 Tax=Tetrapyrgos nigripes TaxID=182062 RepID=A0A8H5GCW9_9AGAR|nr:hypothetical protein D9758_011690 [Tetrapyrgos nigripes]
MLPNITSPQRLPFFHIHTLLTPKKYLHALRRDDDIVYYPLHSQGLTRVIVYASSYTPKPQSTLPTVALPRGVQGTMLYDHQNFAVLSQNFIAHSIPSISKPPMGRTSSNTAYTLKIPNVHQPPTPPPPPSPNTLPYLDES